MNLVKQLKAGRIVQKLKSAKQMDEDEVRGYQNQLIELGSPAIQASLDCLSHGEARGPAMQVLDALVSDETLDLYLEALASRNPAIVSGVTKVLSTNHSFDPTSLIHLISEGRLHRGSLETILVERAEDLPPETLISVLPELNKDAMALIFRILEKSADITIAPRVIELSEHEDWWVRLNLTRLMARFEDEAVHRRLAAMLSDPSKGVRFEAVKALHAQKVTSAIPELTEILRDPDLRTQSATIDALIELADVTAVPHLINVLKDESEYARRAAVEVLNEVATTEAVQDLVRALRDEDWWVRVRAADALGTLGGERVVDAVTGLLGEPDDFLRRYAVEILNAVPNERAVEHLVSALQDEDWWVRERSIDALAKTKDPRAVEPLIDLMESDPGIQVLCVRALGEIGDARALNPICRMEVADDDELRREVFEALSEFSRRGVAPEQRDLVKAAMNRARTGSTTASTSIPLPLGRDSSFGPESGRGATRKGGPGYPDMPSSAGIQKPQEKPLSGDSPPSAGVPATPASPAEQPPSSGEGSVSVPRSSGLQRVRSINFQRLSKNTVLLDRYRILRQIGKGGFGAVYLVEDAAIQDEIILKVLNPQMSQDETSIPRFVRELKLTRKITHPNVIRLFDFLDLGGAHAVSMEYFPGRDLGKILDKERKLPPLTVLRIVSQTLEGLCAAHDAEVIHRDIKPANILMDDDGFVKIVDFGLASAQQGTESRLTKSGLLVGTPEYMAPEQISGETVDARADLYSLGVVMYELVSGKKPFTAETPVKVLFQHLEAEAEPLGKLVADLPLDLEYIVACSMAKNADDRPDNAREMQVMVDRAIAELDAAA